jgi:hypothetical protein
MFNHIAIRSLGRRPRPPRARDGAAAPGPPDRPSWRASALEALGNACAMGFFVPPSVFYDEGQKREPR